MALSGSFKTSAWTAESGDKISLLFEWTATQDKDNNNSTISWTLKGSRSNVSSWVFAGGFKVVIDGDTVYSKSTSYRIKIQNGTLIASGTKTLTHNTDGTRSFSVLAEGGIYLYAVNCTGSQNFTLDAIPRASTISSTATNIGSNPKIIINKASPNFTHTITYRFGKLTGTIVTKTTATSIVGWTIPDSFYGEITTSKRGECVLTCITYNGNTQVGESTCILVVTTDEEKCKPRVSVSATDVNNETTALTRNNKVVIAGISNLRVVTDATAKNSASITSISVHCGGTEKTGADVTFDGASSATIYVIVTDSRGYATRVDVADLSLVSYMEPTIIHDVSRDTPTGDKVTVSVRGKWYNGSFGAVANSLRVTVRRKSASDEGYHTMVDIPITTDGNDYSGTVTLEGVEYTHAYSFLIRLDDAVFTDANGYRDAKYAIVPLSKGIPIFDWGENDFRFNVPVIMPAGPLADYVIEEADDGDWHYRKWAQGITEAWYHEAIDPLPFTDNIADGLYSNDTHRGMSVDIPEGLFNYGPFFTSINASSNVIMQSQVGGVSTTWLIYRLWTSYSTTPSNLAVQIYVVGRWK